MAICNSKTSPIVKLSSLQWYLILYDNLRIRSDIVTQIRCFGPVHLGGDPRADIEYIS